MHSLEIAGDKTYMYPDSIQEMNSKQFIYFIKLYFQLLNNSIDVSEFKILLVCQLLNIKKSIKWFWMNKNKKEIVMDNLKYLSETMESFLETIVDPETGQKHITISTLFTQNPLPKIKNLHGPGEVLNNCTGYEYKEACSAYNSYIRTENIDDLDKLIAILYRKKKLFLFIWKLLPGFNGEVRRVLKHNTNPIFLQKRVKKVSKLPYHVKYGVFIIFHAFETFMTTAEINIDGNKIDLSKLYSSGGDDADQGIGMMGLFYELAESNVFGKLDDVMNTNIYDIITRVYQLIEIQKKLNKPIPIKNDSDSGL